MDENMFGFNRMDEDNFRREFMKFLTNYRPSLESFIKKTYLNPDDLDGFFNHKYLNSDSIRSNLAGSDDMDFKVEKGSDEHGNWEKKSWSSPDGKSSFVSFTRNLNSEGYFKNKKHNETDDTHTLSLLEEKLEKSIREEKYEDAAKIRDLIKSIKQGLEK